MPIHFSTPAANADILGDDAPNTIGEAAVVSTQPVTSADLAKSEPATEGQSGDDINAAAFIKDKDRPLP